MQEQKEKKTKKKKGNNKPKEKTKKVKVVIDNNLPNKMLLFAKKRTKSETTFLIPV